MGHHTKEHQVANYFGIKLRDKNKFPRSVKSVLKDRLSEDEYSNLLKYYTDEAGSPNFMFYDQASFMDSPSGWTGCNTFASGRPGWYNPYDNTIYLHSDAKGDDKEIFRMVFEELGHARQKRDIQKVQETSPSMQFIDNYLLAGDGPSHIQTAGVIEGNLKNAHKGLGKPTLTDWNVIDYWTNVFSSEHQGHLYNTDDNNYEETVHTGDIKQDLITDVFGRDGVKNYLSIGDNSTEHRHQGAFNQTALNYFEGNYQKKRAKREQLYGAIFNKAGELIHKATEFGTDGLKQLASDGLNFMVESPDMIRGGIYKGFQKAGELINEVKDWEQGGHINATTPSARHRGLEGANPGTSASLIYSDHRGRKLEGRQSYPVRVYADGAYVGVLKPGETMENFSAQRIDEVPMMEEGTNVVAPQEDPVEYDLKDATVTVDRSQYTAIPQTHFDMPEGDFDFSYDKWTGELDDEGWRIYETVNTTGTHDPNWYTSDFDPYEYYKRNADGEYDDATKHLIKSYQKSPYMGKNEYDESYMTHPLAWNEDRLELENQARLNQADINKIYNLDGTLKPEYNQQLGPQRYLRPFGPDPKDAPNQRPQTKGRWASEHQEGFASGWGKDGLGSPSELTDKELKDLYKEYKNSNGFGKMKKKEFIERYRSGDKFYPNIPSVDQELANIKTFSDAVNPIKPEHNELQKEFLIGGINSDLYREKLIKSGYENVDEIIAQREEHLANSNFVYEDTADQYTDEYVYYKGGPESSMAKDRDDPAYPVHTNRVFRVQDKLNVLGNIYESEGRTLDLKKALNMRNDYTPWGDESAPTEHGFYSGDEDDALFWAQLGRGFNVGQYLGDKILFGTSGSRAYTGSHGERAGDVVLSPRQAQGLNIDMGGDGSVEQLESSLDEILFHENAHMAGATTNRPDGLNQYDQDLIIKYMTDSGIDVSTLSDHDASPAERKADLDGLRWKMFNTIGYDYRTTKLTPAILQQYKKYVAENPSPSLVNDRNFKFFNDESLINFNNDVAHHKINNQSVNNIGAEDLHLVGAQQSKYGGPAKYQGGSNVQIQEPNLDIQADTTGTKTINPLESIFSKEELDYVDFIQNRKPYRDHTTTGEDPELFYLDLYNTELTADDLLEFYVWKDTLAQRRSLLNNTTKDEELKRLDMDKGAYDIQGFWKSGDYENTDSDGHGADTWKKPNHVTFSNESKYAKNYELPEGEDDDRSEYEGGLWNSDGGYVPSQHNMYGNERLHREFSDPNRPEHLFMGNDLIYNHPLFLKSGLMPADSIPQLNYQQGNEFPTKYQDGTNVTAEEEPLFIPEPNTPEMDAKFTNMYREQDERTLNDVTFDGSTEDGMLDYLKFTENSVAAGYKKNKDGEFRWYPHKDSKGILTIGYGHNINKGEDFSKGLTQTEVDDLLKADMKVHTDLLERNVPEWENLSTLQQNALLDIQYNIRGNVWTKFPSFTKAVVNKDWKNVVLEGSREEYNGDPNQRNTAFYKSLIEPMVEEWRPEIRNPKATIISPELLEQSRYVAEQDNTRVGNNSFGGWRDGSRVTKYQDASQVRNDAFVPVDQDPVDISEGLDNTYLQTQQKYPNFSDQEIYKYYLEGINPSDGMINNMMPNVYAMSENIIEPVPFFSTTFSTQMDIPNLYKNTGEQCIAYGKVVDGCSGGLQLGMEFNTDLTKSGVRDINGLKGDAWQMHNNVVESGGQSLFNYSDYMDYEYLRENPNIATGSYLFDRYNNARNQLGNNAKLDESTLQVGDFVDLFYNGSSYQGEAVRDGYGSNMNSHVGKITEKNGKLYVTHNVSGTWHSDPLENLLENQRMHNGHQVMVVGGYRPKYETGLVSGVSFNPDNYDGIELKHKGSILQGWNGAASMDFLNNLALTMPDIQNDFGLSDGDSSLIAKLSYGTFGIESTFAEGNRYDHKSWARELLRGWKSLDNQTQAQMNTASYPLMMTAGMFGYLPEAMNLFGPNATKDFTEGALNMDANSEGMTQIKHEDFMNQPHIKTLFEYYGIDDPDALYTPAGASRATALVHTINLDLLNKFFGDKEFSDQTKMNILLKGYNKGMDNVFKDFVDLDEESETYMKVTPTSYEAGLKTYQDRHLDRKSYTYFPNQVMKLINYDHIKAKQQNREIASYNLETMTGFETGFNELTERFNLFTDEVSSEIDINVDKINKKTRRGIKKIESYIKKASTTKKDKFIKKANNLLDDLEKKGGQVNEKLKDETKAVKKLKNKLKSIF